MKVRSNIQNETFIFYFIFVTLIILNIFMILGMRLLPFIDLSQHLAYATIYKHLGEADNAFNQYFEFANMTLKHNSLHPLFCSLDLWGTVETGNKIYFIIYTILLPLSILLFIKKLNGRIWLSLLSFLFVFNYNVSWGFVGFLMTIPLCFLALILQYEYFMSRSLKSMILLPLILVLLYLTHILSAVVLLGLLLLQHCLYYRKSLKNLVIRSVPYIPGILLYIFWYVNRGMLSKKGSVGGLLEYYLGPFWDSIPFRLSGLFYFNHYFLHEGQTGRMIGYAFSAFFILCLIGQVTFRTSKNPAAKDKTRHVFTWTLVCYYFLVYLFFFSLDGVMFFSFYRFSVFVFLGLIAAGSLTSTDRFHILRNALISIACIVYFLLWTDYFTAFQKENRVFNKAFFKGLERQRVLSGLIYYLGYRGQPIYIHFPDYYITWHRGIESLNLADGYPNYQLKRKVGPEKLPRVMEWVGIRKNYNGEYNHVDYLLIRGRVPQNKVEMIEEHFELIRWNDPWFLLKNRKLISNSESET